MNDRALVRIEGLKMHFPIHQGLLRRQAGTVKAVDGISFDILEGETLGLVGESGCGKSTAGRTILRLYEPTAGRIEIEGNDISTLTGEPLRDLRPRMQMIFQDPQASLNPRMTVGSIIAEPLLEHHAMKQKERRARVRELLDQVGLSDKLQAFPRQLSGGQQQRVVIARALMNQPQLLLADEPTSDLDELTEHEIMDQFRGIHRETGVTVLLVTHSAELGSYGTRSIQMANGEIVAADAQSDPRTEMTN